jgi:hypothetical protein
MKKLLSVLFLGGTFCSFGQSVSPEVLASAGEHFQNASAQISWTLGEPITETLSNGTNQLTQGFHQTNLSWASTFELDESILFNVYPNPTVNYLSVEVSAKELGANLQLIDAGGRIIYQQSIEQITSIIDFTAFTAGTYRLNLLGRSKEVLKTFTVQKMK